MLARKIITRILKQNSVKNFFLPKLPSAQLHFVQKQAPKNNLFETTHSTVKKVIAGKKIQNHPKNVNKKKPAKTKPSTWWESVIFIVMFFIGSTLIGAISGLYQAYFKNRNKNESNSAELYPATVPKLKFADIGGSPELKQSLSDIVRYFKDPTTFEKFGIKPPKGIIFDGPPGVGKTMFAEALAGEAGVSFIKVSAAEFTSAYSGEVEGRLRKLFAFARTKTPCILFVDELDSIGSKRIENPLHSSDLSANAVVDQLLTLLSDDNHGMVIVAATNLYDSLDPSLIRPGRFDMRISIPLPDEKERESILALHVKNKKLSPSVSLEELSQLSPGFSGAKLAAWIEAAARCALRQNAPEITMAHFDNAFDIINGEIAPRVNLNLKQKRLTAIHEAGHALVGHLLGLKLSKVSILTSGERAGVTRFLHSEVNTGSSKQELLNEICTSLAGRAAEVLCTEVQAGSASDIKRAKHIAEYLIKEEGMGSKLTGKKVDDEIEKLLQVEMQRAQVLLTKNRQVLDRLVNALVKHDVLREADVLKIIANEPGKPFIAPLYVIKSGPDLFSGSQKAATVTNEAEVHDVAFTTPRHPSA